MLDTDRSTIINRSHNSFMQTPRQKEIVDTALDLIEKKGIQGLTIKNLSKEIGISEPAIYRHFESKTDILKAIVALFKTNSTTMFEQERNKKLTAPEKIEQIFARHFATFVSNPALVHVIFSEDVFKAEESLLDSIAWVIRNNDKILTTIIREGQEKQEIRDDLPAGHLALIVMGSLRLFVKKWQFSNHAFDLQSEGKNLMQSIQCLIIK